MFKTFLYNSFPQCTKALKYFLLLLFVVLCSAPKVSGLSLQVLPMWFQHEITVTAPSRGCHLITNDVHKAISKDLGKIQIGLCNLFVQHTSASLTINENADPDVRTDMETALNKIVPASWNRDGTFRHTMEGGTKSPLLNERQSFPDFLTKMF